MKADLEPNGLRTGWLISRAVDYTATPVVLKLNASVAFGFKCI